MRLEEVMVANVVQCSPDESVGVAAKRMRENSVGCLVATAEGAVKGIVTDRDLLACLEQAHDPYQCKVSLHMSRPVIVLRPEEDPATAADVMRKRKIKRLPVARSGKLLGIVSLSDLAAIAGVAAERVQPAWDLITGVIRTQAAQGRVITESNAATPANFSAASSAKASLKMTVLKQVGS